MTDSFDAKRGLRQGDPMSPYLFVLVMEYLHGCMNTMKKDPNLNFHLKCGRMGITHLCFADDLLIFCRGDLVSVQMIHKDFLQFYKASSLEANADKSSI